MGHVFSRSVKDIRIKAKGQAHFENKPLFTGTGICKNLDIYSTLI